MPFGVGPRGHYPPCAVTNIRSTTAEIRKLFAQGRLGPAEAAGQAVSWGAGPGLLSPEVRALVQEIATAHPDVPEVHDALARVEHAAGQEECARAARQCAWELRRHRAGSLSDRLAVARVWLACRRPMEAQAELGEALALSPHNPDALGLMGRAKHMLGELTEAIRCWESMRAHSPHNETVLQNLGMLHQLAQDRRDRDLPGAQHQGALKEIERALRLFSDGQLAESLRVLDRSSRKQRTNDPDGYKLTLMARAWIQQTAGDTTGACSTLEGLGSHERFATDLDRLLFLVRLYESSNIPALIDRAIQVCHYIAGRYEKITILSRLARLYQRQGQHAAAARYRLLYQQAFARRMGQPTPKEVVRAAMLTLLPLDAVELLEFSPDELAAEDKPGLPARSRALLLTLGGQHAEARALLHEHCASADACALDWAYLAQLHQHAGDLDAARAALQEALHSSTHDEQLQAQVLGQLCVLWSSPVHPVQDATPPEPIGADPRTWRRAYELLRVGAARDPMNPAQWNRVAAFERVHGLDAESQRHRARAEALADAPSQLVGHVQSAAAYYLWGRPKGLIHEVWASRTRAPDGHGGRLEDSDLLGNLAPDLRLMVRNLFDASRVYVNLKFPHRCAQLDQYRYSFKVTKEDEPSSGASAGLPVALAWVSLFLDLPIPQDVAATGALITDAGHQLTVRRVGDIEAKVVGAYHKGLRRIVVPEENRVDIEHSEILPPQVAASMVCYARNLDEALAAVAGPSVWDC